MEHDTLAVTAFANGVTAAEREQATRYLAATRDRLLEAIQGLSDAQWNFKPSSERWSIAENMEHMAIVEGRIGDILGRMGESPADSADRDARQVDAFVIANVPDRTRRVQAPERLAPTGRWTGTGALENFLESRVQTERLLHSAPHLRGHVIPHPILGPWDGYQWILGAGGHCARHTSQILEVKSDPNFPAA
jgi:hypothetical protein